MITKYLIINGQDYNKLIIVFPKRKNKNIRKTID